MNNHKVIHASILLFSILICSCKTQHNNEEKIKYVGIERTLSLLNESTKNAPNDVEILFYGQSIVGGMKTNILVDSLRNLFPSANITFKHRPIGGFTIPSLIKTADHDIYHENPDLIIFHAYGGIKDGLFDSLINKIRRRMSSDILLFDHHYVWNKPVNKLKRINKSHEFDSKEIKKIADKYNCGFVNVREQWDDYLAINNVGANELMGNTIDPNVHPNAEGNRLLREIILSKFSKEDGIKYSLDTDSLRTAIPLKNTSQVITKNFVGNRIELVTYPINKETVLKVEIDGKKPSEYRSSYFITRPSKGLYSWMPAIKNISFGKTFPREEDWTVTIYEIDRETKKFRYRVEGSKTGFDGESDSENHFISNSKRVTIKKEDFYIFQIERITKKEIPENFQIKFGVEQIAKDSIVIKKGMSKVTLFRGFNSTNHTLSLKLLKGDSNFKELLVFRPFITIK